MKTIGKIIITITAFFTLSCSDMLNLDPYSAVSPGNVTLNDIPQLRTGMYWKVQEMPKKESYIICDLLGGNLTLKNSTSTLTLINNILSVQGSQTEELWRGHYMALFQVNNLFSIAQGLPQGDLRNKVLGECHYFRAYLHLILVTRYGDVPLMRENTSDDVARTPASQVWGFIQDELSMAINLLGDNKDYYYLSKDAATALKARVELFLGNKDEAYRLAESVIANKQYSLDSFENIFRGKTNSESIFAFACHTPDGSGIAVSSMFYSYNHPNKGSYLYKPAADIMTLFDSNDKRKDISITTLDNLDFINKFPSGQTGTDPMIISRIAEMYLISAEAKGLSGLSRLNELRRSRGLNDIKPTNEKDYAEAVLLERRKEFLGENHYWYDLVRLGKAVEMLGIQEYQTVMPIPESELLINKKLIQNDKY